VIPAAAPAIKHLETALNNLALAAMNDTAFLQQLIAANLALTATITLLTATNKKLVDVATRRGGTPAATPGWGWTQVATPGQGWTQAVTQAATPVATPAGIHATKKTLPRELLLDSRPLREQAPHERDLCQQSSWPLRRRDGLQHLWQQQQGQELECGAHLTGWDG
jgi:hypothetical protein